MAKNGLVLITKATFSAVSSVNINNCFSATYKHYLIVRDFTASAANNAVAVRLRVGGADASGANYNQQYYGASSTTIYQARNTGQTSWSTALGYTESALQGYGELWLSNPFDNVPTTGWADTVNDPDGNITMESYALAHDLTTSYDGFSILPAAGTITGTISVLGLVMS